MLGDYATAHARATESTELERTGGDGVRLGRALHVQGRVALKEGDLAASQRALEEAVALLRQAGEPVPLAKALHWLGYLAQQQADPSAQALQEESLALYREIGDPYGTAASLAANAFVAIRNSDAATARDLMDESVQIRRTVGDQGNLPFVLDIYAAIAELEGDPARALRRVAAAQRVTEETGVLGVDFRSVVGERLDAARAALDETAASAARTAGLTQNPADVLSAAQARNSRMPPNQVD